MESKIKSRKFWVAVGSILAIVLNDILEIGLERESLIALVTLVAAYIMGQSWVDGHK